ncbi:hypothetical protein Acy02nite_52120 [Actinoplanes cyaneus]|uniref:Uncharacterized protein n=1 Tax=Actinoplanes cyaneus TaxID=52696 RepID=A0A919IME1_9ACTN|nr:hypothetical protein [Actinoplanes cyaneus]MCW2141262.1 hypothetical protein [Actinoplanes cyaneus]GID67331.1 hypothetical protein Acy02nite_52120 [Actinoplanes cyaneus]
MRRRTIAERRAAAAYEVLRGRPVRPDYGYLVVLPLLAAAGGALIAWGIESMVLRRRATPEPETATQRRLEPVSA